MRQLFPVLALVVGSLVGCGAKVAVDGAAAGSGGASSTSSTAGSGGAGECPVIAPNDGEKCSSAGLVCALAVICCGATATCDGSTWHVAPMFCGDLPCFGCGSHLACSGGAVCVQGSSGALATFHCAEDPCPDGALGCGCATPLCPAGCVQVSGLTVECKSLSQ